MPELVDMDTIAGRAGVTIHTVRKWRQRHETFPTPETHYGRVPVWKWQDIDRWLKARTK